MRPMRNRGVALIEAMVVATVAVLAALAAVGLLYGTGRARLNNAVFEVSSLLAVGQMRAASTGVPHYALFYGFDDRDQGGLIIVSRPTARRLPCPTGPR